MMPFERQVGVRVLPRACGVFVSRRCIDCTRSSEYGNASAYDAGYMANAGDTPGVIAGAIFPAGGTVAVSGFNDVGAA